MKQDINKSMDLNDSKIRKNKKKRDKEHKRRKAKKQEKRNKKFLYKYALSNKKLSDLIKNNDLYIQNNQRIFDYQYKALSDFL